jgi:O-antigen ligase
MNVKNLPFKLTALVAFLIPALALWVRTGPSYGAALLLLGSLVFLPQWIKVRPSSGTWALAFVLSCMAVLWWVLTAQSGFHRWDKPIKWALGALCLFFAAAFPPKPAAFFLGLPIGCLGMTGLAIWQVYGQGLSRATGFTSAIPWGDTALLLACFTGVYAVIFWREKGWGWRALQIVAVVAGMSASMLSEARGGWISLVLLPPMFLIITRQLRSRFFPHLLVLLSSLALVFLLVLGTVPRLQAHVVKAANEITQFFKGEGVNTSLGIRLEQYRLAFEVIPQKPLLGWGREGFVQETERLVASGKYDTSIIEYKDFIHNEVLDNWAKTGIPGVLAQLALYGVTLFLFWPSARRLIYTDQQLANQALALRLMGCMMGLMYFGFGMTMPYFNHNSGTVFFIFCLICLWTALEGVEREARSKASA